MADDMTTPSEDEILALAKEATPGPWYRAAIATKDNVMMAGRARLPSLLGATEE